MWKPGTKPLPEASVSYRFNPKAADDLDDILAYSGQRFGAAQRTRTAALILAAIERVASSPGPLGGNQREDLLPALRSYPVWLVAKRRSASPHILFYRTEIDGILIVRILHESMDPTQHIGAPDP